ncbi:MAG: hypothetical protein ACFFCS_09400 [Candidatus Hodarchaeota archaeon]
MGYCISCSGKIRKARNMEVLVCSTCKELLDPGEGESTKEFKALILHEKVFVAITIVQIFLPLLLAIDYILWIEGSMEFINVQIAFVVVFLLPVLVKLVQKFVARISLKRFFKEKSSWKQLKKPLLVKIPIYTVLIAGVLVAATFVLMEIIGGLVFLVTW